MNKMKILRTILLFVGVAAVAILLATERFSGRTSDEVSPVSRRNAQLLDASNEALDFLAFRGKIVLVNNWATWCPPCVAEMPSIQTLKNKLKGQDVVFVMVSFDEDREKAKRFVKRKNFDFDIYFPGDRYPYPTSSIPATFILDKSGTAISQHAGMMDYSTDQVAEQLKALANE